MSFSFGICLRKNLARSVCPLVRPVAFQTFSIQTRWTSEGNLHFKDQAPRIKASLENKEPVDYTLHHPIWSPQEVSTVQITHLEPNGFVDKLAYLAVRICRWGFDTLSGYKRGTMTAEKWLNRIIFLETVAGVPGFVGGMVRHLNSLRRMKRDHGWIHTLLEEAENERMHLMTAMVLKKPSFFFQMVRVVCPRDVCQLFLCKLFDLTTFLSSFRWIFGRRGSENLLKPS